MSLKVTLKEGLFKTSQDKGKEFLIDLDLDRLIAPCYEAANQKPKKPRYGGWEDTQIAGHSIGHWLSAAAEMYKVTKDETLKTKILYALDELEYVQSLDPDGYVSGFNRECFDQVFTGEFEVGRFNLAGYWVPWYSIHKIYAGLIDVYQRLGVQKALDIVIKLADWAVNGLQNLTDEQFERMLYCEYGGMNEVMADLYLITKNEEYLQLAKRFCHQEVLDPLAESVDELEGRHANTQIPKVIGAAKLYDITGEERYQKIARFFWDQVIQYRTYVLGGNSNREHFGPLNDETLGIQTMETCNTYNMMKLTEFLFKWSPEAKYMDYYERALYNHILASQDPESGMKSYFIPTEPGHFKIYCTPDESFWCCTGTGMENPARYPRKIYSMKDEELYVHLFIASNMKHPKISLTQSTDFPTSERSTITIHQVVESPFTIKVRKPAWLRQEMKISVNGETVPGKLENGYISITRQWSKGDQIELELPMDLYTYVAKDDPKKKVIMYGPLALAGKLGRENYPETDIIADHMSLDNHPLINVPVLVPKVEDPEKWVRKVQSSPLVFETDAIAQPGNQKITLVPFYDLHHERYTLYWDVMTEEEYHLYEDKHQQELQHRREITVDEVFPNEQQPEVEHQMKMENSFSDYLNIVQKGWRESRDEGYFSYKMKILPDHPMYLLVTYFGEDGPIHIEGTSYERTFEILINETLIAKETLTNQGEQKLYEVCYEIPESLTKDKETIEVKFVSERGKIAGRVFGVRITKEKP